MIAEETIDFDVKALVMELHEVEKARDPRTVVQGEFEHHGIAYRCSSSRSSMFTDSSTWEFTGDLRVKETCERVHEITRELQMAVEMKTGKTTQVYLMKESVTPQRLTWDGHIHYAVAAQDLISFRVEVTRL